MENETITVWDGNTLMIYKEVADMFGLKDGDDIYTEQRFWEVIGANSTHGIAACQLEMDK